MTYPLNSVCVIPEREKCEENMIDPLGDLPSEELKKETISPENHKCEFCYSYFVTESTLVEHMKKQHFKCNKCDYTGRYLDIHIQKQHPNNQKINDNCELESDERNKASKTNITTKTSLVDPLEDLPSKHMVILVAELSN